MSRVFQISTSPGGVPKRAVREAEVGRLGLAGDAVNHPKVHGGPERAVCLYALEHILALQNEGHPVFPGALGENLTLVGLDWQRMAVGVVLELGDGDGPVLQLTQPVTPCNTIAEAFSGGVFRRVDEARRPGWARWYARVVRGGVVRTGDAVRLRSA